MKVRVLMFGALAEVARRDDTFEVADTATVATLVGAVRARYPAASGIVERSCVAVNHDVVDDAHPLRATDEVAILPPMSGGTVWVRLSSDPSVADAIAAVAGPATGATVTFIGSVRDTCDEGPVDHLEYSAYEAMATKVMDVIAHEAIDKWSLHAVAIDHAVGIRSAGAITFVVVCAAPRRDEAFDACRYVTDEVKRRVPIWKKESGPWGSRWVNL
jgi:molybdopterin synthase catalytic subunit